MGSYKLICLSGPDRVGKETQARLLKKILNPSVLISFPNYGSAKDTGHWSAQFVRAALDEDCIELTRQTRCLDKPIIKKRLRLFPTKEEPHVFQVWQIADRMDAQAWIKETLKTSHIIADRYEVDALAFGAADGCSIDWLLATHRLYYPSDLVIVMLGQSIPRPNEQPDLNERDVLFQQRVRKYFEAWGTLLGWHLLDVDRYRVPIQSRSSLSGCTRSSGTVRIETTEKRLKTEAIRNIHVQICQIIKEKLELEVKPLSYQEVELAVGEQSHGY